MNETTSETDSELNEPRKLRMRPAKRLLKMALYLAASAEGRTVSELMHEFGLGRRTTQRMVGTLYELFPVELMEDGRYKRYRISAGVSAFLLAPSAQELADLELAAQMFQQSGESVRAASLRDLGRRNLAALRERQRYRLAPDVEALTLTQLPVATPGPHIAVEPGILSICQMALLAQKLLRFSYVTTSGRSSMRTAAVRGLLIGPRSYIVAAQSESEDPVLFRLDRVSDAVISDTTAWLDPEFDLESFRTKSFGVFQEPPFEAHLIFDAEVANEAGNFRFHPGQTVTPLDDGRLSVKFTSGGMQELAMHLVTWGPKISIVSPEKLKWELVSLLKDLLVRHDT